MKSKSKRRQQQDQSARWVMIGLVAAGALLVAAVLIWTGVQSTPQVAGVVTPTAVARQNVDGLTVGDPNAPVRIDVFEDFQCPACKRFTEQVEHRIITELVESGQAYYVYHNYAFLDTGWPTQESQRSALASLCANEQGKFWEYHDTLFANWNGENQGAFSDSRLVDFATALGLNVKDFEACMDEGRYVEEVQASFELGNQMGVQGTPSVFVNGTIVKPGYVPSFDDIAAAVEAAQP
ncbi:MAG: DsbA family protein [Chloroflexota bacterium]